MPGSFQQQTDCHLHGRVVIDDQNFCQDPFPKPGVNHQRQVAGIVLNLSCFASLDFAEI
jgi:hypothetical protein